MNHWEMLTSLDSHVNQWEVLDSTEVHQAIEAYQAKSADEAVDLAYIKMYISNLKADYFPGQ